MVKIQVSYEGGLQSRATHGPSGAELRTDAPVDNHGRGESFSPTDLVATALGTCMVTVMGIVAERHGWDLAGTAVEVEKHMAADPARRIARLETVIRVPGDHDEKTRKTLERAALTCPVHVTLGERVDLPVRFEWGLPAAGQ